METRNSSGGGSCTLAGEVRSHLVAAMKASPAAKAIRTAQAEAGNRREVRVESLGREVTAPASATIVPGYPAPRAGNFLGDVVRWTPGCGVTRHRARTTVQVGPVGPASGTTWEFR